METVAGLPGMSDGGDDMFRSEDTRTAQTGGAAAFAYEAATGKLSPLNSRGAGGGNTTHLAADASGSPSIVSVDTVSFLVIKRGDKFALRVRDSEAKTLKQFAGIEHFPVDESWRIVADWTPHETPQSFGIQTVIGLASVFLSQELFTDQQRAAGDDQRFVLMIFLMVQFAAMVGALIFERIASVVGTKRAIILSLVLWSGVVIYAYGFLQNTTQAWFMAGAIAMVLGGSQALSRSLFSRMIPAGREASFFGIYEISERGTSWIGPFIFGVVVGSTGSYRDAILSLIVLFVLGMIILATTNTDQAVHDAGNFLPEEVHPDAQPAA